MFVYTRLSEDKKTIFYKNVSDKTIDVRLEAYDCYSEKMLFQNELTCAPNVEYFTYFPCNIKDRKLLIYNKNTNELLAPFIVQGTYDKKIINFKKLNQNQEIINILENLDINGFDGEGGTDKATDHTYTNIYAKLMEPIRYKKINFVEVGVFHGGSSALWSHYLPNAQMLLIDIDYQIKDKTRVLIDWDRASIRISDAYTKETFDFVNNHFPEGIDFMIDDGEHELNYMMKLASLFFPIMKTGGVYVIEDISSLDWLVTLESITPKNATFTSVNLSESGRFDDILVIYKF